MSKFDERYWVDIEYLNEQGLTCRVTCKTRKVYNQLKKRIPKILRTALYKAGEEENGLFNTI